MGSFQQISLGIVCLVAAFAFGSYVNNRATIDRSLDSANNDLLVGNSGNELGNVQSRLNLDDLGSVNKRPAPIATMQNPLPPPSQLANRRPENSPPPTMSMPSMAQDDSAQPDAGVQIPDFSAIAAEFKNTPIELPPLVKLPTDPNLAVNDVPQSPPATLKTLIETPKSIPRIDPPAPSAQFKNDDRWKINSQSDLTADDFAPKLKERYSDSPIPNEPAVSGLPNLQAISPPSTKIENGPNSVRSRLQVTDPSELFRSVETTNQVEPPARIPDERTGTIGNQNRMLDTAATYSLADTGQPEITETQTSERVRAKLPFGLNGQSKSELVRLRSSVDSKMTLKTTKFVDHVVQPGESLQSISTRYFGKPDYYLDIYLANRNKLRNPAVVPAGVTVRVPIYQ